MIDISTTGMLASAGSPLIAASTVQPSRSGMLMSSVTAAGRNSRTSRNPSWPPRAVTTANPERAETYLVACGRGKPFNIPKRVVWKAFKRVKANQGAAGVDKQSIAGFEADLSNNLYKLWNRMCSGSYFPPPVRRVEIPKADGGMRPLGISTVADRIAQEVARRYLEPRLEPVFHTDSYGYRPGRSAIDAVRTARQRCWRADWVLDIDVKGYFDSIDWE